MVGNANRRRAKTNGMEKKDNSTNWIKGEKRCILCYNTKFWYGRNIDSQYQYKCTRCGNKNEKLIEKIR